MLYLLASFFEFYQDMGTTPLGVKVWASLFPFPQLIVGGVLAYTRGFDSPAGWYFIGRVLSFLIAGQVFKRSRFTKMVGPIMHVPFLLIVPAAFHWLANTGSSTNDINMYCFVAYTTAITSFSLLLDVKTLVDWLRGKNPGYIKSLPKDERISDLLLLPPSLLMGIVGWLL